MWAVCSRLGKCWGGGGVISLISYRMFVNDVNVFLIFVVENCVVAKGRKQEFE